MASYTAWYKYIFLVSNFFQSQTLPLEIAYKMFRRQLKVDTRSIYKNIQKMPNGSSKGYCLLGFPFGVLLFLVFSSFPMNESPHQQFFSSLTLSSSLLDHTNALQSSSSTSSLSNSPTISIKVTL